MAATPPPNGPIILFDGVCNLCTGWVQFVIAHDPRARFRFASLQSTIGQRILTECGVKATTSNTMVLVEGARYWLRSDAALRIVRHLNGGWALLGLLMLVPRALRDWVYVQVAENRYRWFGRRQSCMLPTAELRERFLE